VRWRTVVTSTSSSAPRPHTGGEPGIYLIDSSGIFRILQSGLRKAWSDQLAAGVIVICPIVSWNS
jgi:hypothetical protein